MNVTPETVRALLDTLVTPEFDDIVRYDIITRQNDEGKTGVGIDVIMKHKLRFDKKEEYDIERRIRNVMKYISPAFVMVEFYNTTDY
jgi:hypothetical protein